MLRKFGGVGDHYSHRNISLMALWGNVKNHENIRGCILFFAKLTSELALFHECWLKKCDSPVRDKGLCCLQHTGISMKFTVTQVALSSSSHGGHTDGPGGHCRHSRFASRMQEAQVQEKSVFPIGLQLNFATWALEGDGIFILLNNKPTCSLLCKAILSPRPLKSWIGTKLSASACNTC